MKKTMGLVGLFFVGLGLLANPTTGILAQTSSETAEATSLSVTTTTLSGDPPADTEDTIVVDVEEETAVVAEATDTAEATASDTTASDTTASDTTAADSTTDSSATGSYSVVGSEEESRYGTFQVEVFFEDGEIVAIEALQLPGDRKSNSINSRAVPAYEEAIIAAQSADIDAISGATVTWRNYTASVQAALDAAGLAA